MKRGRATMLGEMPNTAPMVRKPARRGPSRLVLGATIVALLLGGAVAAAVVLVGPIVRGKIVDHARELGVEMTFDGFSFWWRSASLEGVRFKLVGVPGIDGQVSRIDVSLSDWEPRRIEATELHLDVVGSAADLSIAIGEWTKSHPSAYQVPVSAHGVHLSWRPSATEAPWLTVNDGAMSTSATGVTFAASHAVVSGVDIGSVGASWAAEAGKIAMGFGSADQSTAPVQVTMQSIATTPTATITLVPTELSKLAGPFGVPLPAPGVVASGQASLVFTRGLTQGPVTGQVEMRLAGWVPPHPVELDGFLFGSTTTFSSKLAVSADRTTVQLSQSRVRASAFDLRGGGQIDRKSGYATIAMSLAGSLPCAAVAQSAAAAHVGSFLAEIVGNAAKRVVDGSLSVRVKITADSRHLDEARVEPIIGVGCGLTPIKSLDRSALQRLPERLRDLANALPELPTFEMK